MWPSVLALRGIKPHKYAVFLCFQASLCMHVFGEKTLFWCTFGAQQKFFSSRAAFHNPQSSEKKPVLTRQVIEPTSYFIYPFSLNSDQESRCLYWGRKNNNHKSCYCWFTKHYSKRNTIVHYPKRNILVSEMICLRNLPDEPNQRSSENSGCEGFQPHPVPENQAHDFPVFLKEVFTIQTGRIMRAWLRDNSRFQSQSLLFRSSSFFRLAPIHAWKTARPPLEFPFLPDSAAATAIPACFAYNQNTGTVRWNEHGRRDRKSVV